MTASTDDRDELVETARIAVAAIDKRDGIEPDPIADAVARHCLRDWDAWRAESAPDVAGPPWPRWLVARFLDEWS